MRLTVSSPAADLDVEADVGTRVGVLRPQIARLTGEPGWAVEQLTVGGRTLDDSHAVGHAPLVLGAVVRLGPGLVDPAVLAVRAPWHVAVLAGPAAGDLVGLDLGREVRVGGVRVRAGRRGVRIRGHRGRRWRLGRVVVDGAARYALRTPATARGDAQPPGVDRSLDHAPPALTWLAPLVGAGALAAVTRQPAFLVAALAVPLVTLAPRLARRFRRRPSAPVPPGAGDLAAVVARSACAVDAVVPPTAWSGPWGADGSLAVVGPRAEALALARSVALGTVGSHADVGLVVLSTAPDDWRWARWVTTNALPGPGATDTLVVADGRDELARAARWRTGSPARHRLLLVLADPRDVPAWCSAVLPTGGGVDGPTTDAAEAQLRRAIAHHRRDAATVPDAVALGDLPGIPPPVPAAVTGRWHACAGPLVPVVGRGPGGSAVHLDLARDGPHVLVGGTTGAGKSELLVALVLSCALHQPPERLAVLLVDFKGGTGLGPVARLPHVVDHVSDLDPATAQRVLVGLRAEVRRRERILAAAGARDLDDLDAADVVTPPRLLVVVDELRALVDDVPGATATFARLAAVGRALGIHLVLATQRPAGAVGADLRANVSLRIALRVTDDADSTDIIDVPDAARIDPRTPGRALVRAGSGLERVQVARALARGTRPAVRLADARAGWRPGAPEAPDDVAAWVRAARVAAGLDVTTAPGGVVRRPDVPWLPALPATVTSADLARDEPSADRIPLALTDEPADQRRGVACWAPDEGHLLVLGGPRSGRTTTLLRVGTAALLAGRTVHAIGLPPWAIDHLEHVGGTLGTVTSPDEPRVVAHLLRLLTDRGRLATGGTTGLPVLLVDGLDAALDALSRIQRGAGADLLTATWRGSARHLALAASGDVRGTVLAHAAAFRDRLVLPVPDAGLDLLAGVPRGLADGRSHPGRAVHLDGERAALCQVALPSADQARKPTVAPVRLRPLPAVARPPGAPRRPATLAAVPLGIGGESAGEVLVDLGRGLLVAGPPGSGRTSTLVVIASGALVAGAHALTTSTGPWPPGVERIDPRLLRSWSPAHGPPPVLLVDDLDELERDDPSLVDRMAELVTSGTALVVATADGHAAAGAYRGALAALVRRRAMVVLDPLDAASADLVGPSAGWLADPVSPAGRGVVVRGRQGVPVQVYRSAQDAP
ncbi:FtsK/SpoIIIE domain-containing protein [Cellulomonas rhizosphaerae]|uniref:FtsK/SpoIIIE domain-containing protein n=1 Tax=Cellulomonas rhizosphaerae TaxID=2293719 RepID=UPI001314F277|nr:FtsK/SpoIIIE domain-containing protein [Cellulomonas rhizosphaerae]